MKFKQLTKARQALGKPIPHPDADSTPPNKAIILRGLVLNRATRRAIQFNHDKVHGTNRPRQH